MPRSLNRRLNLPATRSLTSGRPRHDFLAQALTAFRRSIRATRRLMKLAPRFFDSAVVHRESLERLEQLAWRKSWEPALAKAYGVEHCPWPEDRHLPPVPDSPRLRHAIDHEIEQRALWLNIGRHALADFQQLYPHALPSLTQIARLLDIGITFRRIATGQETTRPKPEPQPPVGYTAEAALLKIYGDHHSTL